MPQYTTPEKMVKRSALDGVQGKAEKFLLYTSQTLEGRVLDTIIMM